MKRMLLLTCLALAACGGGKSGGPDPLNDVLTGVVAVRHEIEPNDSVATADAITLPAPTLTDDYIGAQVIGTVNKLTDGVDTFAFTSTRIRTFDIKLCDSCQTIAQSPALDVTIIYFEVLDQLGNVLLSTRNNFVSGNLQEIDVSAGVLYYIKVTAGDATNTTQDYSLSVIEELPF